MSKRAVSAFLSISPHQFYLIGHNLLLRLFLKKLKIPTEEKKKLLLGIAAIMVNVGEEKNIFPFQEEANFIFNTSLVYEIGALKPIVMPLLEEITKEDKEYAEATRLINMLKYFEEIPKEYVPNNSLLKEFLGGGDFKY